MSSRNEEEYFYKVNQQLIAKMKEKVESEKKASEREGHCPLCASEAKIMTFKHAQDDHDILICEGCGALAGKPAMIKKWLSEHENDIDVDGCCGRCG